MKKLEQKLWKRYKTFAKKEGWKNLAYPHHLGSFCYGLICSFLSIPVFIGLWWTTLRTPSDSINFTLKELHWIEQYSVQEIKDSIPWLITRLDKNPKNKKTFILCLIRDSRNHLIATEKGNLLLCDEELKPLFNEQENIDFIRSTYLERWNLNFKIHERSAA